VVFFGNDPSSRAAIPGGLPGDAYLGFPGVGGVMAGGTADYARIRQQPTALPQSPDPRLAALGSALSSRGLAVQRRGPVFRLIPGQASRYHRNHGTSR
jgi:hypothetical protein